MLADVIMETIMLTYDSSENFKYWAESQAQAPSPEKVISLVQEIDQSEMTEEIKRELETALAWSAE